ncbi:MAG: alginate lyase family protein [Chloroflexota bacterium]
MNIQSLTQRLKWYSLTLSRMTPLQIFWRCRRLCLQQIWRRRSYIPPADLHTPTTFPNQPLPRFGYPPHISQAQSSIDRADEILKGTFSFLNQSLQFEPGAPDWAATPDEDPLWAYNLHYFEYTLDLLWAYQTTKQKQYLNGLIQLIQAWLKENKQWGAVAWNAYPLSKRLIIWTTLLGHLYDDEHFQQTCLDDLLIALGQQAAFLYKNLEYDVDNNHLITNARALVWAGIYLGHLPQAERWFQRGLTIMEKEAERQVLADGGHWERSTSYQLVVLQDFLETLILLDQANKPLSQPLAHVVPKMVDFIQAIIKPDGDLPLLNDSVLDYPVSVTDLLAVVAVWSQRPDLKALLQTEPGLYFDWIVGEKGRRDFEAIPVSLTLASRESVTLPKTGYYVMQAQNHQLIFDCAPIGPRHSPAHAHADMLHFVLTSHKQPLIIDAGVYEYKAGNWRDYFRSTAAHNTVTVDSLNQSVFWGSFRVADMAEASIIAWSSDEQQDRVVGSHNGYQRLKDGVTHQREICYQKPNQWIITDQLTSTNRATVHQYSLRFHLAPAECLPDTATNGVQVQFQNNIVLDVQSDHPQNTQLHIDEGWWSKTWKQKIQIPVIHYSLESPSTQVIFKTYLTLSQSQC